MDKYTGLPHEAQNTLLDAQLANGQTVRAFCFERDIKGSRFYTWRNRRRRQAAKTKSQAGFSIIKPVSAPCLKIALAGGLELVFATDQFTLLADLLLQMDRRHAEL